MKDNSDGADVFSKEETYAIRRMLDAQSAQPLCPRCRSRLRQEGPVAGGGSVGLVWRVACKTCGVSALVAESMARSHTNEAEEEQS